MIESYFNEILVWEYFDGPVAGVARQPNKSFYFQMIAWDDEHWDRLFALKSISEDDFYQLWSAYAETETPRVPLWCPQVSGSSDVEEKIGLLQKFVEAQVHAKEGWILVESHNLTQIINICIPGLDVSTRIFELVKEDVFHDMGKPPILDKFVARLAAGPAG